LTENCDQQWIRKLTKLNWLIILSDSESSIERVKTLKKKKKKIGKKLEGGG
jgi:hypothetical protein